MAPRSGVPRFSKYLGFQKDDMTEVPNWRHIY